MTSITGKQPRNKCDVEREMNTSVESQQCFSALNFKEDQQEIAMETYHVEQKYDLFRQHSTPESAVNPLTGHVVTQKLIWVEDSEKCSLLLDLLNSQTGTSVKKCDKTHDAFSV